MKRTTHEPTPDFWTYARNYLHDYLPKSGHWRPAALRHTGSAWRTGNRSGIYYSCSKQQSTVPVEVLLATLWDGHYLHQGGSGVNHDGRFHSSLWARTLLPANVRFAQVFDLHGAAAPLSRYGQFFWPLTRRSA
jgi:hypothetical protein